MAERPYQAIFHEIQEVAKQEPDLFEKSRLRIREIGRNFAILKVLNGLNGAKNEKITTLYGIESVLFWEILGKILLTEDVNTFFVQHFIRKVFGFLTLLDWEKRQISLGGSNRVQFLSYEFEYTIEQIRMGAIKVLEIFFPDEDERKRMACNYDSPNSLMLLVDEMRQRELSILNLLIDLTEGVSIKDEKVGNILLRVDAEFAYFERGLLENVVDIQSEDSLEVVKTKIKRALPAVESTSKGTDWEYVVPEQLEQILYWIDFIESSSEVGYS